MRDFELAVTYKTLIGLDSFEIMAMLDEVENELFQCTNDTRKEELLDMVDLLEGALEEIEYGIEVKEW